MSEKLDGVRAYWDGNQFLSRQGNLFHVPDWFAETLPATPLDGELWLARKSFQRTVSIVRRQDRSEQWREISFLVFDAPAMEAPFEDRMEFLRETLSAGQMPNVRCHPHELCRDVEHLKAELARVEALGGEGLMLREPGSRYEAGRSTTLLKVKTFHDAEARVIDHQAGAGRHKGRLGALLVELPNGVQFSVGTGFSDAQRENPPAIGSAITFRYQELSDRGVPRFPSFVRVRRDAAAESAVSPAAPTAKSAKSAKAAKSAPPPAGAANAGPRRFELVEGTSAKFWEIARAGNEVTVRFGRIGTNGQSQIKSFADEAAAQRHTEKLIAEKSAKGYAEQV